MKLTKEEQLMVNQIAKMRDLFEKVIDHLKVQANSQKTVRGTNFETAAAVIDAEGQIKGMYKLYSFFTAHVK